MTVNKKYLLIIVAALLGTAMGWAFIRLIYTNIGTLLTRVNVVNENLQMLVVIGVSATLLFLLGWKYDKVLDSLIGRRG